MQQKSSLMLFESLSYKVSQCSDRNQVDSNSGKEQAEVFYCVTTSLYMLKPWVWSKVNMSKSPGNHMYEKKM